MMLKIILITLFSTFYQQAVSQNVWKQFYANPLRSSFSYDVAESYDNGYIFEAADKGIYNGYPWFGWIVKTDINGNKLWDKIIDGHKFSDFACLDITTDGGFIAGGRYDNSNSYQRDAFVMKFNACAEPEWCSFLPESNEDESIISDIYQLPDGGYICERYKPSDVDHNRWSLIKLRSNGTVEWCNYYDLNQSWVSQLDFGFTLTSDTCFLVNAIVWDSVNPQGDIGQLPLWYKVDKNGNLLWEREWELSWARNPTEARITVEDINGNYYTGGMMMQPLGFSFIYKLNHEGDTVASYRINDNPDAVVGVVHTLNYFNDTTLLIGTQYAINNEGYYWSLNYTDTLGNIRSQKSEEERFMFTNSLITSDNKILILGITTPDYPAPEMAGLYKFNSNLEYDSIYTMPRTYDSLCPHPIVSDTIPMPGICTFVSLPEPVNKSDVLQVKVYPNPASEYVTIEIPEYSVTTSKGGYVTQQQFRPLTGEVQLSVINLNGQIVKIETFDASVRNHAISVTSFTPGMYILHFTQKGKFVAQGKVMVVR